MDYSYEAYPAEMTQEEVVEGISLELHDDYFEEPQHELMNFMQNMWLETINANTMVYYREDDEDGGDDDEAGFVEDSAHISESIKYGSDNITATQKEVQSTPALDGYDNNKTKEETDNILDQISKETDEILSLLYDWPSKTFGLQIYSPIHEIKPEEDEDGSENKKTGIVFDSGLVMPRSNNITATQKEVHQSTPVANEKYDKKKTKGEINNILDQISKETDKILSLLYDWPSKTFGFHEIKPTVEEKPVKANDLDVEDCGDKTGKDDIEEFMDLLDKYEDNVIGLHHALSDTISVEKDKVNNDVGLHYAGYDTISLEKDEDNNDDVHHAGYDTISVEQDEERMMNGRDTINVSKSVRKKGRWRRFIRALRNLFSCHSPKTKDDYG